MINRDKYLNLLIAKKWNGMIKVITGIRRCGKSYLLFNIFKNHLINNVYLRDIVDRNNLKNDKKVLGKLLDVLSSSIGSLTNPPKLEKAYNSLAHININKITISKYLDAFVDSFFDKQSTKI